SEPRRRGYCLRATVRNQFGFGEEYRRDLLRRFSEWNYLGQYLRRQRSRHGSAWTGRTAADRPGRDGAPRLFPQNQAIPVGDRYGVRPELVSNVRGPPIRSDRLAPRRRHQSRSEFASAIPGRSWPRSRQERRYLCERARLQKISPRSVHRVGSAIGLVAKDDSERINLRCGSFRQFLTTMLLNEHSLIEDNHSIAVFQGAEPMRNDEHRALVAVLCQQSFHDDLLRFGIQRRSRFIQQEN